MKTERVAVNVNEIHLPHPQIRAEDWRSPLVCRLLGGVTYKDGSRCVESSFRPSESVEVEIHKSSFVWTGLGTDFKKALNTYQAPVITEFATLGLACGLLTLLTGLEVTEVTRRGEKADYWLGDRQLMLEVSGQQTGSLETLCLEKASQLTSNPFSKNGYVCVANYADLHARLWFYAADESGVDAHG